MRALPWRPTDRKHVSLGVKPYSMSFLRGSPEAGDLFDILDDMLPGLLYTRITANEFQPGKWEEVLEHIDSLNRGAAVLAVLDTVF